MHCYNSDTKICCHENIQFRRIGKSKLCTQRSLIEVSIVGYIIILLKNYPLGFWKTMVMVPLCGVEPLLNFSCRALFSAIAFKSANGLPGLTFALVTVPFSSTVISTETLPPYLYWSWKRAPPASRLPCRPLLMLIPALPVPPLPV